MAIKSSVKLSIPTLVFFLLLIVGYLYIRIESRKVELQDEIVYTSKILNQKIVMIERLGELKIISQNTVKYMKKSDSIRAILSQEPRLSDKKQLKKDIEDIAKIIVGNKKLLNWKRIVKATKDRGEPLGFWEEDWEAHVENAEDYYSKPIEMQLKEAQNKKKKLSSDHRTFDARLNRWKKKYDIDKLKNEEMKYIVKYNESMKQKEELEKLSREINYLNILLDSLNNVKIGLIY